MNNIHKRLDFEVDISMTIKNALDELPMQDADFKKFGGTFTLVEQSFAFWYNQLLDYHNSLKQFFSRKNQDNPVQSMRVILTQINDILNKIVTRKLFGPITQKSTLCKTMQLKFNVEF